MNDVEKTNTVLSEKRYTEHVESSSTFGQAAEHPGAVKVPARIFTKAEEDKLCASPFPRSCRTSAGREADLASSAQIARSTCASCPSSLFSTSSRSWTAATSGEFL